MQARTGFLSTRLLLLFIASSYAMTLECADTLEELQDTLIDLHYSTHDHDIFGVSLSLKSISESAKSISLVCSEELIDFGDQERSGWIQGCQESFEFLRDIISKIGFPEDCLLAVKELERFYPIFKGTCLFADDYLLVEDIGFNDFDIDCEEKSVKSLIQELFDGEDDFVEEILARRETFLPVN